MSIPFVYSCDMAPDTVPGSTLTLPANGGAVAIPLLCADDLTAQSITVRTTDVSLQHTIEIIFLLDNGGIVLPQAGLFQSFTYTAAAAANRNADLAQATMLPRGCNWLIARNAGVNPSILAAVATGTIGGPLAATATLAGSLSGGIGSPNWAASTTVPLVRVNGSVNGLFRGAVM